MSGRTAIGTSWSACRCLSPRFSRWRSSSKTFSTGGSPNSKRRQSDTMSGSQPQSTHRHWSRWKQRTRSFRWSASYPRAVGVPRCSSCCRRVCRLWSGQYGSPSQRLRHPGDLHDCLGALGIYVLRHGWPVLRHVRPTSRYRGQPRHGTIPRTGCSGETERPTGAGNEPSADLPSLTPHFKPRSSQSFSVEARSFPAISDASLTVESVDLVVGIQIHLDNGLACRHRERVSKLDPQVRQ